MKYKIHVPTKEYAFIEVELEGTAEEAIEEHDKIAYLAKDKEGLNSLQWAKARDHYAKTGDIDPVDWEACSRAQRYILGQFKKANKRNNK